MSDEERSFKRVTDTEIGIDDFYDVWEKVKSLSPRWFFISFSLRLNLNTISLIEANNGGNCEKCLYEVLTHWLNRNYDFSRFGRPSWRNLCVAVSNGGQNEALAEEIANEHLVPTSPSTGYEQTPSPLSVTSDGEQVSTLSEDTPLSLPFGYTISVSRIFSSCRDKGSTLPSDSVVYVSGKGQLFHLQVKINELQLLFLDNLELTMKSLKSCSHTVSDIIEYMQLHVIALLSPELRTCTITSLVRQEFSSITTLAGLFIILQKYVSWFNYEFIVKLSSVFLSCVRSLKINRKWSKYRRKLKDYFTSNNDVAIKCADGIEFGLSDVPGTKVLVAKVARDDYTFNDLFFFRQAIPDVLKMSQYKLYFCSVHLGCLELKYCIPDYIYSVLFPLTDEQLLSLANIGVIKLSCCSFEYENKEIPVPDILLLSLDIYDPLWYENTSTPLHEACWKRLNSEVEWLINKFGYELFQRGRNGWSPLHAASYGGHLDVLSLLINQYHCDPSTGDNDNVSCLHVASYKGHLDIALYLLDTCNINPDVSDNSYNTALLYAAMGGHCDLVTLLLNRNCNFSQCNKQGATLSLLACKSGNIALVHKLEALDLFLPTAVSFCGYGVLHYSCMSDSVELVQYLMIRYQLSIDVTDQFARNPLHVAAWHTSSNVIGTIGKMETLLSLDIFVMSCIHYVCHLDMRVPGSDVYSKLFAPPDLPVVKNFRKIHLQMNTNSLLQQKRLSLLSSLLKQVHISAFNINAPTVFGESLLHLSCYSGNVLLAKALEQYNISPSLDYTGKSPVHYAALSGSSVLLSSMVTQYSLSISEPDYSDRLPLVYACQSGSVNAVEYIINSTDIDINTTDNDGMTCFHHSCHHGHLDVTQYLIDVQDIDVNMVDSKGRNGVHHAAYSGNQDLVEYLINEKSLLPTAVDSTGCTALHYGIMKLPLVKDLVNVYKLDPHQKDNSGKASVHYAAEFGDINVLEYLINSCNCELSIIDDNGQNIFHFSSVEGHFHFIKHILAHYPQYISLIHSPDNEGILPIHLAFQSGNSQLVTYLIDDIKCDVTSKTSRYNTCVTYACISGNLSLVKLLIEQYKLHPLAIDKYGLSSLHASMEKGHIHIMEWIANKCNINVATHCATTGFTLVHRAAKSGQLHALQHLVNTYQCDINATTNYYANPDFYTALHFACERRHVAVVLYLTSLPQCNITAETSNHSTIIHLTCKGGSLPILKHLVENCSDQLSLYAINDNGKASIHFACEKGALNIIKYIIEHSPNLLDLPDAHGYTPLLTAAYNNHLPVVKYLNSQNCNISVLDDKGFNVLHISSEKGCFDIVKYLIDGEYVDPNITDCHAHTSLHIAVLNAQLAIVEYLMDSPNYKQPRVQFEIQDANKNASLHIACETGQPNIVSILSAAYLSHDISILQTNNKGWTPLHCVAANGHVNTATTLLTAATSTPFYNELLIAVDTEGCTAFHLACSGGHYKMFLYLSNCYPVGVSAIDNSGRSLLHASCQSNSLELVQCLVSIHELDTELHDKDGVTCLHLIAERGNIQIYQYMMSYVTVDLTPVDNEGRTPFHYSCLTGEYSMSEFLISTFGYHPEDKDNNSFTPLHAACQSGDIKLVSYFLKELKCNPSVQTNTSKSLLYFASKSYNLGLVRLLIESYNLKVHSDDINVAKSLKAESIVQYLEFCQSLDRIETQLQEKGLKTSMATAT